MMILCRQHWSINGTVRGSPTADYLEMSDEIGGGGEPRDLEGYWPDDDGEVYTPTECIQDGETMPGGSEGDLCMPTGGDSPSAEEEPADDPVPKDELADSYENECGYTNPQTQSDAFEVDARYALGHSAAGEFRFPDGISRPDGVKRGVLIDGSPNYSYFRALLEVKYKESGLLQGSQTRKYIDELARPYTELPGYETTWPPFLVIASLSTNSELRYFDDGGATLQYAEQKGINGFHVTLQKDEGNVAERRR